MIPFGFSVLLFVLIATVYIGIGLWKFGRGIDGLLSVSNIQVILWTGVILAGYLTLAISKGDFLDNIPDNLLYLMGISVGSTVAATGIRAVQEPKPVRRWSSKKKPSASYAKEFEGQKVQSFESSEIATGGLFNSEKVPTELSVAKMQMLAWTLVSLAIFVVLTLSNILSSNLVLPDVESGLLTLMGISHAGYNGNKIADKPPKQLVL